MSPLFYGARLQGMTREQLLLERSAWRRDTTLALLLSVLHGIAHVLAAAVTFTLFWAVAAAPVILLAEWLGQDWLWPSMIAGTAWMGLLATGIDRFPDLPPDFRTSLKLVQCV